MDTNLVLVILAAFAGAVVVALLGWSESAETFVFRKFLGSILRGLVAAVVFGVGYQFAPDVPLVWSLAFAFCGGATIDEVGKKGLGVVKGVLVNTVNSVPPPPPSFEGLDKLLDEAKAKGWDIAEIKAEAKKRGIPLA